MDPPGAGRPFVAVAVAARIKLTPEKAYRILWLFCQLDAFRALLSRGRRGSCPEIAAFTPEVAASR